MGAAKYRIHIEQGATWRTVLTLDATDLTGYTARMQIRDTPEATAVLLELTTENGRITINGGAGQITLLIAADDTSAITWTDGVYDLEIVSAGSQVTRLLQGAVAVSAEVTR